MFLPKPVRALALASTLLLIFLLLQLSRKTTPVKEPRIVYPDMKTDPNLEEIHEPAGHLWRADDYAVDNPNSPRINATILSLVRNEEVDGMVTSMRDLERTWNHKFNYPWTFFNDKPFNEEFKTKTRAETRAPCYYEVIPPEHWAVPSWINQDLVRESGQILADEGAQYGNLISYHQMCRWNSGIFYHHPALKHIRYYWRVEPKVHFFCDVDYDVFRYMQDRNKTYGFTINLYDDPKTMPSLWPETMRFAEAHSEHLKPASDSARPWLEDKQRRPEHNEKANGYSTCHFWSNFEIADMEFFRSRAYEDYFNHLDRAGGFFYERWGDAPVHSIALGLFEDKSKIHWFRDIGYQHIPYFNCPNSPKCSGCKKGLFTDGEDFLYKEDCRPNWFKYVGKE
ncbi:putative mannosyltransferase ktr4 [Xanthoria calcicola]